MKLLALALLATLPTTAALANSCPENTELQLKCKVAPKKGDSILAIDIFDKINVCRGEETAALVITKDKETVVALVDSIEDRMGGTTYRVVTDDVDYTFSTPVVFAKKFPATLGLDVKKANMKAAATYTCTR